MENLKTKSSVIFYILCISRIIKMEPVAILLFILFLLMLVFFIHHISEIKPYMDYIRSRKFNFVTNCDITVKGNKLYITNYDFEMFQVWGIVNPKLNKHRTIDKIDAKSFVDNFNQMNIKYNFEPTVFVRHENENTYFVIEKCELQDNTMIMTFNDTKIHSKNKLKDSLNVFLYIDSSNVFVPFDGSF